jgi:hypothetical protein
MNGALILYALSQVAVAQVQPPVVTPTIPLPPAAPGRAIAWDNLPPVPFRNPPELQPSMHEYAEGEVESGRCHPRGWKTGDNGVTVDVAILIMPDTGPRLTIPRAIDCPTVEQYAAGLVMAFSRNNLGGRTPTVPQWYRATLRFEWAS